MIAYRFYEAVVHLPLQKAQALDPAGDAFNDQVDPAVREHALAQREMCYKIVISALRSLKGVPSHGEYGSPHRPAAPRLALDQASRNKYICQIVQLGVKSPDRLFHEYLYRAMIDLGLENELLEYGGPDLVPFLQSAGREPIQEVFLEFCYDSDLQTFHYQDFLRKNSNSTCHLYRFVALIPFFFFFASVVCSFSLVHFIFLGFFLKEYLYIY